MKLAVNYILKVHTTLNESLSGVYHTVLLSSSFTASYCILLLQTPSSYCPDVLIFDWLPVIFKENSQLLHAILNTHMYAGVEEGSQFRLG